ncbi:hypothetical protein ACL6C3_24825 [Capilliphycus salinus ALCB114379]|uniref:hypothetical protein n=1 Tax=Capilliphycus salinus TaxID=2768948 RepID=UPI0039A62923
MMPLNSIVNHYRSPKTILSLLSAVSFAVGFGLFNPPAFAQIDLATVQEILDGEEVFIEEQQAKLEDRANLGQLIHTENSRAGLEFNNGAAGRIGTNSRVTVGQCIDIQQGQVVVSGPANGCIGGFSVGVKGTLYIMETNEDGTGNIKVLEGEVEVISQEEGAVPVILREGQKIGVLPGILGDIQDITPEELALILAGELFSGFNIPITPEGALQAICQRIVPSSFSCSANGIPTPNVPTPPVPSVPRPSIPGSPF